VRISTGGVLPTGADAVARQEDVDPGDGVVSVPRGLRPGRDVRGRGEVVRAGAVLVAAGTALGAHVIGAVGAAGVAAVRCRRRPRVAILATGAELVPLGATLPPGGVYDSSRLGLRAQAEAAGAEVVAAETVGDDPAATEGAVRRLLGLGVEVLLTAGGMSAGPHDHVRGAFAASGLREVFRGLRVVPCRPTGLYTAGGQVALGLPGNPVSAAVAFHLVGRPLLGRDEPWERRAPLAAPRPRHADRAEALRCREERGMLVPLGDQGSHDVAGLAGATALALLPAGPGVAPAGEVVPWCPLA
jgi:molybdopterin molybdotransferase